MLYKELIRGLQILTTSSASRQNLSEDDSQHLMENVLVQNLASFITWLPNSDVMKSHQDLCSHWLKLADFHTENSQVHHTRRKFADLCISIVKHIIIDLSPQEANASNSIHSDAAQDMKSGEYTAGSQEEILLSLEQKKILSSSLQFVVVLAISPYLNEGVGIPVSHRLGPGQILLASAQDFSKELSEVRRFPRLLAPLRLLVDAFHTTELKDLIVRNHISDLVTTIVQVRRTAKMILQHSQRCAQCDQEEFHPESESKERVDEKAQTHMSSSVSPSNSVFTLPVDENFSHSWLREINSYCNTELDKVFTQANIPILLQELLTLAGLNKADKSVKTAPWFRRVVVCMIRDIIMQPGGILHLISPLMPESNVYDTKHWKTCEAIAKIISHCPVTEHNVKAFYASVSQQLIDLINVSEKPVPQMVVKIVGEAISQLTNLQRDLMEEFCLCPLRAPILRCCSYDESRLPGHHVVLSEKELIASVHCMHRLYVQGQNYQSSFCSTLQPVVGVLFAIFKHVRGGVAQLRSLTMDLLGSYLSCLKSSKGVVCLLDLLLSGPDRENLYPTLHSEFALVSGTDSCLKVIVASDKHDDINSWAHSSEAILEILTHVKSEALTSELFINLLQRLTDIIASEATTSDDIILPVHCLSLETKTAKLTDMKAKMAQVSMISAIGETYGHTVITNTHHILLFTQITLKRCLEIYKASDDSVTLSFEADTVTMAMGLLMATLSMSEELSNGDKQILDTVLPMLSTLSSSESLPFHVKEMADNLKVVVATRGRVWPDPQKREPEPENIERDPKISIRKNDQNERPSGSRPLIEVLDKNPTNVHSHKKTPKEDGFSEETGPKSKLQQAMEESCSQMVPVQGHGLICLARLLEDRDADAVQRKDALLKIFMKNLTHLDSYIYLAAVNGLSALGNLFADDVVPCLANEFRSLCLKDQNSKSVETTLKVGEALVKATRRLGEVAPKYRDVLLPAILCGCSHDNELVRASCLSGLAEVCKLLRFSIHPVLQEVLACCSAVIKSDPCCEPRKAAALTVTSLLQGLGKDSLETLSKGLKELYQAVKHAAKFDSDEKVKLQATLALNELEDIMKGILFPEQKLQKTITILGHQ